MKMKSLKSGMKLVIGTLLSVMFLMTAQAQESPEILAKQKTKSFKKTLKLTDQQNQKVGETFMTFYTKLQKAKAEGVDPAERKKRTQIAVKEREESFKKILTTEQWEGLMEKRKREKEHARQKRAQQNQ